MIKQKRTKPKVAPLIIWHLNFSLMMVSIVSNQTSGLLAACCLRWRQASPHFQRLDWKILYKKFKKPQCQKLILAACSFRTC